LTSVALGLLVRDAPGGRQVLLLRRRRDPYGGLWSLPGGKAEPGEGLEEACARELREELGWEVGVDGLALLVQETLEGAGDWLLAIFRCRPPDPADPAPEDCAWFALDALEGLDVIPTDRRFIADALALPPDAPVPVRRARVGRGPRILSYE
jgi:8-oxo-dGTP diphosphatase